MIPVALIAYLMILHFAGDFYYQSEWMAKNKSKSNRALLSHVAVYSMVMLMFLVPVVLTFGIAEVALLLFVSVNAAAHFATDWVTSRVYARVKRKGGPSHIVAGFDQLLHGLTLLVTAWLWLTPGGA